MQTVYSWKRLIPEQRALIIIRDHQDKVIIAAGNILPRYSNAEEAEALALLHGARLANEWTNSPIIFESDCASVVKDQGVGQVFVSHLRSIYTLILLLLYRLFRNGSAFLLEELKTVLHMSVLLMWVIYVLGVSGTYS
jgi:hypothetical protein